MKKPLNWFPLHVDSWLLGSTRFELTLEQRAIFVDFLALGAKDEGFIRANEDMPYPTRHLANVLEAPEEIIKGTIERCIETGKLTRLPNGTLYVTHWKDYQLTPRWVRELESPPPLNNLPQRKEEERKVKESKGKAEVTSKKGKSLPQKRKSLSLSREEIKKEFKGFWKIYPEDGGDQAQALEAYEKLREKEPVEKIERAVEGYLGYLKHKRIKENFEQAPMFAAKFLSSGWKRFLDFKYEPPL